MSKVAHYLQEHLTGEVMTSPDARRYFATDGSIFALTPAIVVYPQNENDIRKTARFTWQLAERGRVIPMTARGAGTDQGGAALGAGIMMAFRRTSTASSNSTPRPAWSSSSRASTTASSSRPCTPMAASCRHSRQV
jgi:hypothetical protein